MDLFEHQAPSHPSTVESHPVITSTLSEEAQEKLRELDEQKEAAVRTEMKASANWLKVRALDQAVIDLVNEGKIDRDHIKSSLEATARGLGEENVSLSEELMAVAVDVASGEIVPRLDGQRPYDRSDIPALLTRSKVSNELAKELTDTVGDEAQLEHLTESIIPEIEVDALRQALAIVRDQGKEHGKQAEAMSHDLKEKEAELGRVRKENEDLHINIWEDELQKDTSPTDALGEHAVEAARKISSL